MTVAIALVVIDINQMNEKKDAIQEQLSIATQRFQSLGKVEIHQFQFIDYYDKRTLSAKHIHKYKNIGRDISI